jgi:hypothetical protein
MSCARTEPPRPRVELLRFQDCPNHPAARVLLDELLSELAPGTAVEDIDATEPAVAQRHRFPGSPTIRIDGWDVDPSFEDPGDYTPRCGVYWTADGLRGIPERARVEAAIVESLDRGWPVALIRCPAGPAPPGGPAIRLLGSWR